MSEFWSNIGRKVNTVSSSAAKKVDELTNLAKLNLALREKENALEICFEKLGSLVYDKIKRSYETDEEIAIRLNEADALLADISRIKSDLRRAKNTKACETCGKDTAADAKFCSSCGAEFASAAGATTEATAETATDGSSAEE